MSIMSKTQRWDWATGLKLEELSDQHLQAAYKLNWDNLCKFDNCRKNCKRILCLACFDKSWIDNDSATSSAYDNFDAANFDQKRADLKSFVGLKNLGATCYVNCLLQLWFHNPALRKAIYEWDRDCNIETQQQQEQDNIRQRMILDRDAPTIIKDQQHNQSTQTPSQPSKRPRDDDTLQHSLSTSTPTKTTKATSTSTPAKKPNKNSNQKCATKQTSSPTYESKILTPTKTSIAIATYNTKSSPKLTSTPSTSASTSSTATSKQKPNTTSVGTSTSPPPANSRTISPYKSQRSDSVQTNPIEQLQLIFARLQFTNKKSIDPFNFINSLALNAAEQQDAQEFGNLFFEFLEKSFANQKEAFVSRIIQSQFCGRYSYATICDHCKHSSVSDSTFYELDLSIQNLETLHDCLNEYFRPVPLDGKYNCSRCDKAQSAHRKIILKSLPPTLNLQLLRFVYDVQRNIRQKLNSYITFPEVLDMAPYLTDSKSKAGTLDLSIRNNSQNLPSNGTSAKPHMSNIYILSAVLIHRGSSPHSGHYIAHIKDRISQDWYKFNDDSVERIGPQLQVSTDGENITIVEDKTENSRTSESNGDKVTKTESKSLKSKTAYMLVYQAQDNEALAYPGDHSEWWELPEHLQTAVAEENSTSDEIFESLQIAREVDLQIMDARKYQIRCIYEKLVCRDPSEKFEFISKAWLQTWLTNSSSSKFSPIDNSELLCIHDKLDFRKIDQVKCVRSEGVDLLYKEFGGGPRLRDAMCRDCVELEVKLIQLKDRLKEDQKFITSQAKFKLDAEYDFADAYIVGKNSYRDWQSLVMVQFEKSYPELSRRERETSSGSNQQNSSDEDDHKAERSSIDNRESSKNNDDNSNSESDDEAIEKFVFNSDLMCEHNQLINDPTAWRIVPKEVWTVFKHYFGNDPTRPLIERNANTIMCPDCKRQEVELQEIGDLQKQKAHEQKVKLPDLFHNRKRASWISMLPHDEFYALDRQFLTKWQKFVRNPCNQEQPTAVKNRDKLVCEHGKSLYNYSNSNPILPECPFVLIRADELEALKQYYPVDHEIKFTIDPDMADEKLKLYMASLKTSPSKKSAVVTDPIDVKPPGNSGDNNDRASAIVGQQNHSIIDDIAIVEFDKPVTSSETSPENLDLTEIDWSECVVSDPDFCSDCHEMLKQNELKKLLNYESATIYITKVENICTYGPQNNPNLTKNGGSTIEVCDNDVSQSSNNNTIRSIDQHTTEYSQPTSGTSDVEIVSVEEQYPKRRKKMYTEDEANDFVPPGISKQPNQQANSSSNSILRRTTRRNRSREQAYTIKPTQTLQELKKDIFTRCQVLPVDQRLFLNDVLLDDNSKTMSELRIVPNCSLKLEVDRPITDNIDLIEDEPMSRKSCAQPETGFKGVSSIQTEALNPTEKANTRSPGSSGRDSGEEALNTTTVDIKIGFLVGSKRLKHDRTYSRPGRQLLHVFNYGVAKLNLLNSAQPNRVLSSKMQTAIVDNSTEQSDKSRLVGIKFVPVIAETYGNESESVKQTIDLISKHGVKFIIGPQETCQIESRLASIFNVPMISHFCPQWRPNQWRERSFGATNSDSLQSSLFSSATSTTFIQTKPPHWKIVQRVVTLIEQLLEVGHNWYPQQLVLLYFKEPLSSSGGRNGNYDNYKGRPISDGAGDELGSSRDPYLANDAIQYKLIGELLEIKLNELLALVDSGAQKEEEHRNGKRKWRVRQPLTVLNWHTTFHYGYTRNPFRKIVRRHLFQQNAANQSANQCHFNGVPLRLQRPVHSTNQWSATTTSASTASTTTTSSTTKASPGALNQRAAIYIVVGHYYEHLGLMLALNELALLGDTGSNNAGIQHYQQVASSPILQPQRQPQKQHSSVAMANNGNIKQQSVVIGVDIEQYDERDDSVRFLRGLLMDESGNSHHAADSSSQLHLESEMYRSYLGVVPAKPNRMAEFLDEMKSFYERTAAAAEGANLQQQHPGRHLEENTHSSAANNLQQNQATNQTLDSIQLTARLFQFIRLPAEAFYLYDSIMLLGVYFDECIRQNRLGLSECSDGRRAFEWFRNRNYISFVNNNLAMFDSFAQTDGSYSLITRRITLSNESNEPTGDGGDFGLMPIGQFIGAKLELQVESWAIGQVWLPLWCHLQQSNSSECLNLASTIRDLEAYSEQSNDDSQLSWLMTPPTTMYIMLIVLTSVLIILVYNLNFGSKSSDKCKQANEGWFDQGDERNFLKIVHFYLKASEISGDEEDETTTIDGEVSQHEEQEREEKTIAELHCYMFPFPSCKFVHWLTALYKLKEMMFQFQSNISNCSNNNRSSDRTLRWPLNDISSWKSGLFKQTVATTAATTARQEEAQRADIACSAEGSRSFFLTKHKGSASLKLLLNKYKSVNSCFCRLTELYHPSVVELYGATLAYNVSACESRLARLIIEKPKRGNLREAFASLAETLDAHDANGFKDLVSSIFLRDLLDGLDYLHSKIGFHGELRATNCLITADWRLKLSGFHAHHMRRSLGDYEFKLTDSWTSSAIDGSRGGNLESPFSSSSYLAELVYSAPEVLDNHNRRCALSGLDLKLADIYSFAFIFYELLVGKEPWTCLTKVTCCKLLLERVKEDSSFRPPLSNVLDKKLTANLANSSKKLDLNAAERIIRSCWSHSPDRRPQSVEVLKNRLELAQMQPLTVSSPPSASSSSPSSSLVHHQHGSSNSGQVALKFYSELLEKNSISRLKRHKIEQQISMNLKLKLLPQSIVAKLCNNQPVQVQSYECVSFCLFRLIFLTDLDHNSFEQLNEVLSQLDGLVDSYRKHIHLVDSQVDSLLRYLIYSGDPLALANNSGALCKSSNDSKHIQLVASFALQLIDMVNRWQTKLKANIQVRCSLHCGPVMGGLLPVPQQQPFGSDKSACDLDGKLTRYVLLGSTIQLLDTLELTSSPQRIQISSEFRSKLSQIFKSSISMVADDTVDQYQQSYVMIKREGKISFRNSGDLETYWLLNGPRFTAGQRLML